MHTSHFHKQSSLIRLMTLFVMLWTMVSCTEVDLKSGELHQPTRVFQIEWPSGEVVEQPDTLLFIANRMVITWRTAGLVSTQNKKIQVLFPELPTYYSSANDSSSNSFDRMIPLDSLPLRSGPTHFFAINWNEKYAVIKNFEILSDVMEVPVGILEQAYISFPLTDTRVLPDSDPWVSYNTAEREDSYLAADLPALWIAESDEVTIDQDDNQDDNAITLKATRLSQQLDIQFSINCAPGVTIDKIRGGISGIPQSIKIDNGIFSSQNTLRLLFTAEPLSKSSNTIDNKVYSLNTYHKKINVIAVIPNDSPTAATGNGLLQLNITGRYTDSKGETVAMNHVVLINMYHALHNLDLVKIASLDAPLYQSTKQEAVVIINDVLTVDEEGVKVRGQQVQSLDYWTVCDEEISVEV